MILALTPAFSAVGNFGDITDINEFPTEPEGEVEGEFSGAEDHAKRIPYTDANIVGGSIYYDPDTGTITGCDSGVITCVIPRAIGDVAITKIGDEAFKKTSLMEITIPDSVTEIGYSAFSYSSLVEVDIPASVKTIGDFAFSWCDVLKKVTILGAATLGDGVFEYSKKLEEADISNVVGMGKYVFEYCESLTNVKYPQALDVIPNSTFYECKSLTKFVISKNVKKIASMAFYNCKLRGDYVIPENVTEIGVRSFSGNNIETLTIKAKVKSIPKNAFENNKTLKSVVIPEGVLSIEEYAFNSGYDGALKTVYLPSTLNSIGLYAFYLGREDKYVISDVYFGGCKTKWQNVIIANGNDDITVKANFHFASHEYIYLYDDTYHWLGCEYCGTGKGTKSQHRFGENGLCLICGYGTPEPDEPIEPEKPECDHDFEIKYDRDNHWKICSVCGLVVAPEPHSEPDSSGNCTECGFELKQRYDVNKDGKVSSLDAVIILRALAGLD